jgi:hypothetical protein
MVTINWEKIRRSLKNTHKPGPHPQLVFLLASHFAGMAAHAVFAVKH